MSVMQIQENTDLKITQTSSSIDLKEYFLIVENWLRLQEQAIDTTLMLYLSGKCRKSLLVAWQPCGDDNTSGSHG